jgi:glycogen(starch) synthase
MVGRTRYALPLDPSLARKFDALDERLELRVLASRAPSGGADGDARFRLLAPARPRALDGVLFYLRLVPAVARELRAFRPDVLVAADPFTGLAALVARRLARARAKLIVEVHGDWRVSTRLYGSSLRRLVARPADLAAGSVLRRADAVRALSGFTARRVEEARGRPPDAVFPTYSDLTTFAARPPAPLPKRPTALFVGALERYKNVDGLAAAWRRVARELPGALLVLVGTGSKRRLVDELVRELPGAVVHHPRLPPAAIAEQLDAATALVLPSRFEGLGRIVIEAFARGRGVVGSASGGIPDLVRDGVEGLLVDPEDTAALAAALVRVLSEPELAERLGAAARRRYDGWHRTPEEFAAALAALVERAAAAP